MNFIKQENDEFLRRFSSILCQIIFLTIPISLLLLILRAQIVRVVLGAGNFGWADTRLTTACLGILALNLIAQALVLFLSKTFYAAHNTKIPAIISIATVAINIILSLSFVSAIRFLPSFSELLKNIFRLNGIENVGVVGLSLAYSLTAILESILLLYMFYKRFPKLRSKEILNSLTKVLIASFVMFVLTFVTRQLLGSIVSLQTFWGVFFQLAVSGCVGVAVYIFVAYLLKSPEIKTIEDSFIKKFLYPAK